MKKKEKLNRFSFLLFLILLIGLTPAFSYLILGNLLENTSNSKFNDEINIKSSDWWDLSAERIFIDGDATGVGAKNWTWAESQDWCTGLGTWASPYIIENITIDCNQTDYGIYITDSDVYFRIQNCTIFNTHFGSGNDAIRFWYVTKATIYNNTLYSSGSGIDLNVATNITISENIIKNGNLGIHTSSSNDIKIIGNTIKNNSYHGIRKSGGLNHTIIGNTIMDNYGDAFSSNAGFNNITGNIFANNLRGINLEYSERNCIEGNQINNNTYAGIELYVVTNSTFISNELNDNEDGGIYFNAGCKDNYFTNNTLTNGGVGIWYGKPFDQLILYEPIDSSNTINSRPIYFYVNETGLTADKFTNAGQVLLINCNNSLISNANASYSTYGISLFYCENTTMTGCDISNNNRVGLLIEHGANNKLLYSTINNNGLDIDGGGIEISHSPHTYLYNNTIKNSFREGIQLSLCNYSAVINNTVKYNGIHSGEGLELYYSSMCEIIGNIVNDNYGSGILVDGNNCNITDNIANGNYNGILIVDGYNNVSGNSASYNTNHGFYFSEDYSEITGNTANLNGDDGFYFQQADFHILINNFASNNSRAGFHFEYCDNITILDNIVMWHVWEGIKVENSENYTIMNNILLNNEDAIEIEDSKYFLISNNVMHGYNGVLGWGLNHSIIIENDFDDNTHSSVAIIDSEDNFVSDNLMNYCGDSVYLRNSFGVIISNNEINMNEERGIWIETCDDIEILNNNASFNVYGLWVAESTNLDISGNTFNNNSDHGIVFWDADDNEITYNTINGNTLNAIFLYDGSTGNIISHNIMIWNNQCIVEENSNGNTIFGNVCENRPQPPNEGGETPPIPGYDILFLTVISFAMMILLLKKRKSKIKYN